MDTVATARVPAEIKKQGDAILRAAGHTPTDLINAAYRFVLECGRLPNARELAKEQRKESATRALSPEQLAELQEDLAVMTFPEPESWKARSFQDLKDAAWEERYAHFA